MVALTRQLSLTFTIPILRAFPLYSLSLVFLTQLLTGCMTTPPPLPSHMILFKRHAVHTTTINGQRIAYLDEGTGPPLILIHGFGGSIWQWEHQLEPLSKYYRVITLDMIGSGLSDKPELDYSPTFLLNMVLAFMDTLGLQQATLIGNSLGAAVGLGMALLHPERVHTLILISGFPANVVDNIQSPSYKRFIEFRLPIWAARLSTWVAGRWITKQVLQEIIHDPQLITPLVIERSYHNRQGRGVFYPLYSQIDHIPDWEKDFAPKLGQIAHPTLIIWGDQDRIFPLPVGQSLHKTIAHSEFFVVPKTGHIPQWEDPQTVNAAILAFLRSSTISDSRNTPRNFITP